MVSEFDNGMAESDDDYSDIDLNGMPILFHNVNKFYKQIVFFVCKIFSIQLRATFIYTGRPSFWRSLSVTNVQEYPFKIDVV